MYNVHIHGIRGWQRMILTHVLLADLWKHSLEHKWTSDRNLQEAFGKLASSTISRISTLCYFLARSKCMYWILVWVRMDWTLVPDADTLLHITRNLMQLKEKGTNTLPSQVFRSHGMTSLTLYELYKSLTKITTCIYIDASSIGGDAHPEKNRYSSKIDHARAVV